MSPRIPNIITIIFLVASAAFVVLNLLTDRSSFWAVWVIWAMGMVAAGVIGLIRLAPHRLLGLWLGAGGVLQLGLFLIDLRDANGWWFFWPLGVWVVGLMAIAGLTVNLLDSVPTSRLMVEGEGEPPLTETGKSAVISTQIAEASRQTTGQDLAQADSQDRRQTSHYLGGNV